MTSEPLPFTVRTLTVNERRREDLYLFLSPKGGREVGLLGALTLAQALPFEFTPTCEAYVERPRRLRIAEDRHIELDFWTRHERGLETFWLLVPADDTSEPNSRQRVHRESAAIIEAAQAAQIRLEFVYEEALRKQADRISTCFRLLPYVQTAVAMPSRMALREQVLAIFATLAQATVDQIEGELRTFHPADVRAIACDLIHDGKLALVDPNRIGRFSTVRRPEVTRATV